MTTRIMLAEEHTILRAGLQSLIEREPDMEIVGQAKNGQEAVDLTQSTRFRFNVHE